MTSTGGLTNYADFTTLLTAVTGQHDIFLVFKAGAGKTYVASLNRFSLM